MVAKKAPRGAKAKQRQQREKAEENSAPDDDLNVEDVEEPEPDYDHDKPETIPAWISQCSDPYNETKMYTSVEDRVNRNRIKLT